MIYLAACCVNNVKPAVECLEGVDIDNLYRICHAHMLDALVGMTLKKSNVTLPKLWEEKVLKAVRKNILYPVLDKLPVLLPFCWIVRIVKMVFSKNRRKRVIRQLKSFFTCIKNKK